MGKLRTKEQRKYPLPKPGVYVHVYEHRVGNTNGKGREISAGYKVSSRHRDPFRNPKVYKVLGVIDLNGNQCDRRTKVLLSYQSPYSRREERICIPAIYVINGYIHLEEVVVGEQWSVKDREEEKNV